jgi:hypothetical protein
VEFKKEKILLYNTQNGVCLETELKEAIDLILQIYESKNLGVVLLTKEVQANPEAWHFC